MIRNGSKSAIASEKRCNVCSRSFSRSEHLARHIRTHTKEKPFGCPHCAQTFQRADVRTAHIKNVHEPNESDPDDGESRPRKRVRNACDPCRKRKTKCDGHVPCASCRSSFADCHFSRPTDRQQRELSADDEENNPFCPTATAPATHSQQGPNRNLPNNVIDLSASAFQIDTDWGQLESFEPYSSSLPLIDPYNMLPTLPDHMWDDAYAVTDMSSSFWFDSLRAGLPQATGCSEPAFSPEIRPSSLPHMLKTVEEYLSTKNPQPSSRVGNQGSRQWYATPPDLAGYDRDVLRIFVGMFRKHIPNTFRIFGQSDVEQLDQPEYVLAMTAVGALFCNVDGSQSIARLMYNDARRLFLGRVRRQPFAAARDLPPANELLAQVLIFILLEIYGLCSGDKRGYEFVEVFRGDLLMSAKQYFQACTKCSADPPTTARNLHLIETLHILDCYRVIVMQQPSTVDPFYANVLKDIQNDGMTMDLQMVLSNIIESSPLTPCRLSNENQMTTLGALCAYAWSALYNKTNDAAFEKISTEATGSNNTGFTELRCEKWFRACSSQAAPELMVMFHLLHILLHANVTILQAYAHGSGGSSTKDSIENFVVKEIRLWAKSWHRKIATAHAEQLIAVAETIVEGRSDSSHCGDSTDLNGPNRSTALQSGSEHEAPHVPYAVYYAGLVLWCGATVDQEARKSINPAKFLTRAQSVLSSQKLQIATLLTRVIGEIAQAA